MDNVLETLLNVKVKKLNRSISGGCINSGSVYETDGNKLLFVKQNSTVGVNFIIFNFNFEVYLYY